MLHKSLNIGKKLAGVLVVGERVDDRDQGVRGKGLMIGIELDRPCTELVGRALARRLLINVTADRVIRLLPPLIIDDREIDIIVATLRELIAEWNAGA